MAMRPWTMLRVEKALKAAGHEVYNLGYPSRTMPLEELGNTWLPGALSKAGLADAPRADWSILVVPLPETAITIPRVRPSAIGMARGTAMRAARDLR